MPDTLRNRLETERGFTLIELLVVMIILAILTAIAIPSYLSFRDRANKGAAAADLRAVVPSIEAYAADHHGAYDGMTAAGLRASYDRGVNPSIILVKAAAGTSYCVQATVPDDATKQAFKTGPLAEIQEGACP
ncbi:MAG TPA: prepilin-type N-terminal cleavage/methylation domain-containing protein [Gaiellaceae bacterium]|jgi:prepilin-type N-terminal cleavage/methylation domain-containing protein